MIRIVLYNNHRKLVQRLHWRLGLARRSRIARVIFRQIGIISTHRKIRHLNYIKWYQISRLIGELIECFFSYNPQNHIKIQVRQELYQYQPSYATHAFTDIKSFSGKSVLLNTFTNLLEGSPSGMFEETDTATKPILR